MAGLGENPTAPDFSEIERGNHRETADAMALLHQRVQVLEQSRTEQQVDLKLVNADVFGDGAFGGGNF